MRLIAVGLAVLLGTLPAAAEADVLVPNHDELVPNQDEAVVLPSFTESSGCDGPQGARGPYATSSGYLPPEELLLGPWGDFFGRDMEEVHSRLVPMQLPMMDRPYTVWVHERVAPALQQVIDNLDREAAAGNHYTIRAGDTWSYNPITIPPGRSFSFHAVGAAIDINSLTNPYRTDNVLVTDMPNWFVEAWTEAGWCWGGDWLSIKDAMHFSWRGPLYTPDYDTPAPIPARTEPSSFDRAITVRSGLGATAPETVHLMADVDRDGAADIVRLRAWTATGHLGIEIATAHTDYEACSVKQITAGIPRASGGYTLADALGDGRPDLWSFDDTAETLRIEIFRWDTDYQRGGVLLPEIPTQDALAYLVGDHDRDGRSDLYVVRSGDPATLEIWPGPRFRRDPAIHELAIPLRENNRLALGDHDLDGVPDLYVLAPGNAADLLVLHASDGFATGDSIATGVSAPPGFALLIADYDGDGRDDLVFMGADGSASIHLGGERSPGENLTSWFSGSWDRDWQAGQGCPPAPGFDLRPGFTDIRFADATGPGAAFSYPNPATGVWTLADINWSWWWRLSGRLVDVEPIDTTEGPGYALLLESDHTTVELRSVGDGAVYATIDMGKLPDPVDLAVVEHYGAPAVAAAFAGDSPRVIVRDLQGTPLAIHRLAGLSPTFLLEVGDATGDGHDDLVAVGTLPGGSIGTRTLSVEVGLVSRGRTSPWHTAVAAAALPATGADPARVAVLVRHPDSGRGALVVQDARTGERVFGIRTAPPATGALTAMGDGQTLVVTARNAVTGRVIVEGRDPHTGERRWAGTGSLGFDPADVDSIPSGVVAVLGHRRGDANVEIAWWDPTTGRRLG